MTLDPRTGVLTKDRARPGEVRHNPYQGLIPFHEEDRDWFFGRVREKRVLAANLRARRLTVAYGPSGVGKTSLLRAGVVTEIRSWETDEDDPPFVVAFDGWSLSHPLEALKKELLRALEGEVSDHDPALDDGTGLAELIGRAGAEHGRQLLLILDQFEEYFRYTPDPTAPGTFGAELPGLLARSNDRINVLLAIRDDRIARLDAFRTQVPILLDNLIPIRPLDRDSGREAIIGPIDRFNEQSESGPVVIEPTLVDAVLEQIVQGGIRLTGKGSGGRVEESAIEAPFLQLVMSRLWDEAQSRGLTRFPKSLLDEMGGAGEIVQSHLDVTLGEFVPSDKTVIARMLERLVTPSGTKIAHQFGDLTTWGGVHVTRAGEILQKLDAARVVKTVEAHPDEPMATRYELYHDILAAPALSWTVEQERIDGELAKWDRRAQKWGWLSFLLYPIPIGLWFSVKALRAKPRDRPTRPKARIGFAASVLGLLFWLGIFTAAAMMPVTKSVFDVTVGDCLESPTEQEFANVGVVDCARPHDLEVISVRSLGGGPDDAYPGTEALEDQAADLCLDDFATYVGVPYEFSQLDLTWFLPTADSWVGTDDRSVTCAVIAPGGEQLTGTVRGSGR